MRTPSGSPEPPRNRSSIIKRKLADRPTYDFSTRTLGNSAYRNPEMEQEAAKLQAEFEALMNTREKPKDSEFWKANQDADGFYEMMTDFYSYDRHDSPTTRLRHQKDNTCESKDILSRSMAHDGKY